MPVSPAANFVGLLQIEISVDGTDISATYPALSIEIHKEINRVGRATVVLRDGTGDLENKKAFLASDSKKFDPGTLIQIKAGYDTNTKDIIFKGIIIDHGVKIGGDKSPRLVLKCKHQAVKMTIGRKNRSWDKSSDSDAIKKIMSENSITGAKCEATAYKHPKLIQYYATDWDFLLSRAEANGYIVTCDDGKMVVGPPVVSGSAELEVTYGESIIDFDGHLDAAYQLSALEANVWDMKKQAKLTVKAKKPSTNSQGSIKTSKLSSVIGASDIELNTIAPLNKNDVQKWADGHLLRMHMSRIHGYVSFPGHAKAKLGGLIELKGVGDRFNGPAFISKVTHNLQAGTWITSVNFGLSAIPYAEQMPVAAPPSAGQLYPASGLHNGLVKQIEEDPDGELRILVTLPLLDKENKGIWARFTQPYATKQAGFFFMPEVGDEVVVGFLNEDPRFPIVVGMMYGSKIKSPYPIDKKNNIKAIVTKNKLKIEFEDEKKIIKIFTPGGNSITIDDSAKAITLADQNKNEIKMSDAGISIKTMKDIVLDAKGKINMKSVTGVSIEATGGNVEMKGIMVQADAKAKFTGKGNIAELQGAVQAVVKGAIVMIN